MFKKLLERLMNAKTADEVVEVLYAADGVDMMYQREKINWKDHEMLFEIAARFELAFEARK